MAAQTSPAASSSATPVQTSKAAGVAAGVVLQSGARLICNKLFQEEYDYEKAAATGLNQIRDGCVWHFSRLYSHWPQRFRFAPSTELA